MVERIVDLQNSEKEISHDVLLQRFPLLISDKIIQGKTFVVGVSGASAAGKSTISRLLEVNTEASSVLSMDDYLMGWGIGKLDHDSGNPNKPYFARLNPLVYDLNALFKDIKLLKQGKAINKPVFDELKKAQVESSIFKAPQILILEGIYSLVSPFLELSDATILVEASLHDRLIRKIVRNSLIYKQSVDEIITTYLTNDEPTYPFYRGELRNNAQLIVNNPLSPTRDFNTYSGSYGYAGEDRVYAVSPKNDYGIPHPDEKMHIVKCDGDNRYLRYTVGNKTLVNAPLSSKAIKLIEKYYNFS